MALAVAILALVGLPSTPSSASDVSTSVSLWSREDAEIDNCGQSFGISFEDSYDSVSINSRPEISAPISGLEIRAWFSQECIGLVNKYSRLLELILPSGERIALSRDSRRSSSTERRYSIYCQGNTSCWSHWDVYNLELGTQSQVGSYGLRFTTSYLRTICTSSGAAYVCERNIPTTKTFDVLNFFRVTQVVQPTPTPTQESGTLPQQTDSPIVEAPETFETVQRTLPKFTGTSSMLSKSQKSYLSKLLRDNPTAVSLTCTGTRFLTSTKVFESLQLRRAKAVCAYAESINPSLSTSSQTRVTSNLNTSNITLLTLIKTTD
jgi:hypothetical protein